MNVGGARGYRGHLGIKNHLTTMHKSANENYMLSSYGTVVRDFESEAKTRCNFQF